MFLYDILLQRCRKASWKILLAPLYSSPLCFTLNYKASLYLTEFFPKRHKLYSYAIQNVNTHIPKSENQLDWWKGIQCWRTCQNSNSTEVAEEIKPVYNTNCSQKNNLKTRIQTSVPKFLQFRKGSFLACKRHTTGTQKLKRYTREYLPI